MKNIKELLALSIGELQELLSTERRRIVETKLSIKSKKEKNTSRLKKVKKYVAQILTFINKKSKDES